VQTVLHEKNKIVLLCGGFLAFLRSMLLIWTRVKMEKYAMNLLKVMENCSKYAGKQEK
jgi:hypothetical protein